MANLIENRHIRVFISSTFLDMQDERDELMKKTFPLLRRKAAERDVMLTELDLRWGITPEESESGKVVEICLREIENSVPFFIGIIGNRYGWVPSGKDLEERTLERYKQVPGYVNRHLSVTEMEMQFGVLERPEEMHAFFFLKEQETDNIDDPVKLAALKKAVRENGRYPVSAYSSPEDLANQVEAAFTKLLDELYPEGALSELEKERIGQWAYLNSLCQNYIRTEANFRAIEDWMTDWDKHQLVITGASGLGKSALVANWVKGKLISGDGLPYRIIYHFVGNGGSLGSHGHVIKALCDEIRDRYGFNTDEKEDKTDEKVLEELFNRVAAEGDKPLLIVLDAVNQIIDIDHSKRLNWLPIPPKKVKILFTTLENDETMEVFKDRHYPIFTLQPLSREQRKEMVAGYLSIFSKKLQPYQVDRIVDDLQCQNTLVLKTLLDELVNFGVYERLDMKIDTYLGSASVEDFYGILLKGYETDFGEPFVKHILSLIAVSRNGLSEDEILAITRETPLHWSQFFCAIRQHLVVKNGLVSFAHSYIRKAVEDRFLYGREDWKNHCREEIVALLKDAKSHRAMDEVPYQYDKLGDLKDLHDYLMDLEVFTYLNNKEQTTLGKYWHRLIDTGRYSLEEYFAEVNRHVDVRRASCFIDLSSFSRTVVVEPKHSLLFIGEALRYTTGNQERANILNRIGQSFSLIGDYREALKYAEMSLKLRLMVCGDIHKDVANSYNSIAFIYGNLRNYNKALDYYQKSLEIRQSLFSSNHQSLATSYNNIGSTYDKLGDHQKALEYKFKSLEIRQALFGDDNATAISYNNIGFTYGIMGNHTKALEYKMKAHSIWINLYGEKHPNVAISFNNLGAEFGALRDSNKELIYRHKALSIARQIQANGLIATLMCRVGLAYKSTGQQEVANDYFRQAAEKYRELGNDAQAEACLKEIVEQH